MTVERKGPIDWRSVRETVARMGAASEATWIPAVAETKRILRRRAALLAVAEEGEASGPTIAVVAFTLASECYCIEASYVREVRSLTELTSLPGTPPFVLGIVNLRGEIVSVVDIGSFFDLPRSGLTDRTKILVLSSAEMVFAIAADALPGTWQLRTSEIQPVPSTFTGVREKYLLGITGERLIVLDGARLLHDESIVVRQDL